MKEYKFYGWEKADCKAVCTDFSGSPRDLYDALNKTLGQCLRRLKGLFLQKKPLKPPEALERSALHLNIR